MSSSLVLEPTMEPVPSVDGGSTIIETTFEVMIDVLLRDFGAQRPE